MKKSNKIIRAIVLIAVFIIVTLLGFFVGSNLNKKNEVTLCKIATYDGEKIKNYDENKRPFIISDYNGDAEIKVNGENYEKNRGYYKPGKYEIEIKSGNKKEKCTVKINEIDKNKQNEYNIYITAETLPTFFASFDMIKNKDVPSFVWYQRSDTLNNDELKKIFSDVTFSQYIGQGSTQDFLKNVIPEIETYVNTILKKDENAHFNLYVTAEYYWMEIAALERLGLTSDRVNTVMYSCGTVDYVVNYRFTEENTYNILAREKEEFETELDKVRSNFYKQDNVLDFLKKETGRHNPDYVLINSLRENVKYYLQFPDLITFKDEEVKKEMENANIQKIIAKDQFNTLTNEQKEIFFKCINLDKEKFDTEYFNKEDGKYLIITGTRPFYGTYSKNQFENMMDQVIQKYGEEYTIIFKPHPMALPEGEMEEYLNNKGIKVLPGRMPMEAISFIYDGLKLGGYASSLYMSVDEGSALFFFHKGKDDLVEPLNVLYDDLFKDAEFIQPQQ